MLWNSLLCCFCPDLLFLVCQLIFPLNSTLFPSYWQLHLIVKCDRIYMVAYYTGKTFSKKTYLVDLFKEMLYFCILYKLVSTVLTYYFSTNLLSQRICLFDVNPQISCWSNPLLRPAVVDCSSYIKATFFAMASLNVGLLHDLAYTALIK